MLHKNDSNVSGVIACYLIIITSEILREHLMIYKSNQFFTFPLMNVVDLEQQTSCVVTVQASIYAFLIYSHSRINRYGLTFPLHPDPRTEKVVAHFVTRDPSHHVARLERIHHHSVHHLFTFEQLHLSFLCEEMPVASWADFLKSITDLLGCDSFYLGPKGMTWRQIRGLTRQDLFWLESLPELLILIYLI